MYIKRLCTTFKTKIIWVEMIVIYFQNELFIQLLMFQSPYNRNHEEKVYFIVISSFSDIEIHFFYLYGNYKEEKMQYFVLQKADKYLFCIYVCESEDER